MRGLSVAAQSIRKRSAIAQKRRTGITLLCNSCQGRQDIFDLRPEELRRSAQGVPILAQRIFVFLERNLLVVRLSKLAALEDVPDVFCTFDLIERKDMDM